MDIKLNLHKIKQEFLGSAKIRARNNTKKIGPKKIEAEKKLAQRKQTRKRPKGSGLKKAHTRHTHSHGPFKKSEIEEGLQNPSPVSLPHSLSVLSTLLPESLPLLDPLCLLSGTKP